MNPAMPAEPLDERGVRSAIDHDDGEAGVCEYLERAIQHVGFRWRTRPGDGRDGDVIRVHASRFPVLRSRESVRPYTNAF
jgi:hypothetical protein